METTLIRKAYRFRLEPSAGHRAQLERFAGASRWVWNWALTTWRAYYAEHGTSIPVKELSAQLTALKQQPETAWLGRVKGSRNRGKARIRVARLHQQVARQRADFLHKLTTRLVRTHGAVCIEDLNLKGLARTKLAKSILDVGMGELRRQLTYKGAWYGTPVAVIDRFYPSSKRCHECGHKNAALTLADRVWTCPACGRVLDRDLNAARNIRDEGYRILAAGHAERQNACGAPVRLPTGGAA